MILLLLLFLSTASPETAGIADDHNDPAGRLTLATWNVGRLRIEDPAHLSYYAGVIDSLNADLIALQEIGSSDTLKMLMEELQNKSYRGFLDESVTYHQKTGFLYDASLIDSLDALPITSGQNYFDWAGRYPFAFTFRVYKSKTTHSVTAINIHAKADRGNRRESYHRRYRSARSLYRYLLRYRDTTAVILLGDYNDDIDWSIYHNQTSPYAPFASDTHNFRILTRVLSDSNRSTHIHFEQPVDHITISDELFDTEMQSKTRILIPDQKASRVLYREISDHYPVYTTLNLSDQTVSIPPIEQKHHQELKLLQNFPNPSSNSICIPITLGTPAHLSLEIFDRMGRKVSTPAYNRYFDAGSHMLTIMTGELPSGIYLYRIRSSRGKSQTKRMTIIR